MSKKFSVAALEFTEDQVQVTIIRPTVMPGDRLVSKVETFTTHLHVIPGDVMALIEDAVEDILEMYEAGLRELPAQLAESPADDEDPDSIEVR